MYIGVICFLLFYITTVAMNLFIGFVFGQSESGIKEKEKCMYILYL